MASWSELIRGLGQALLDVLKAEIRGLETEVQRSGRELSIGLGLVLAALGFLFWTLGALLFAFAAVLAIWLPLWGAALIVAAVFALAGAVLAWFARKRFARFENPLRTARRRFEDHMDWVESRLLVTEPTASGTSSRGTQAGDPDDFDGFDDFSQGRG